jgi:PHB de-polymerase C-terminus
MHPERVNTLIVAGAPIDTSAGNGPAQKLMPILIPRGNMALYKAMVKAYGGIVPGINNVMGSIAMDAATHVAEHLKLFWHVHDREYLDQFSDFYDWYLYPINLPGQLYLWAVEHLFVKNEMFKGELEVAGQTVSLRSITCPVFLLGGDEDDITPWQQVHNMRYAVGSSRVRWYIAPGGHIGLFIGHQSQAEYWTPILAQVRELSRPGGTGAGNNGPSAPLRHPLAGKDVMRTPNGDAYTVSSRAESAFRTRLGGPSPVSCNTRSLVRPVARTRSSRTASRVPAMRGPRGRAPGRALPGPRTQEWTTALRRPWFSLVGG